MIRIPVVRSLAERVVSTAITASGAVVFFAAVVLGKGSPLAPADAGRMQVTFKGTPQAELFGRIVNESFAGTLEYNLVRTKTGDLAPGFIHASPPGQGWSGTMWSRDGGTYLRELTLWGAEPEMRLVANACMDLVSRNEEGYYA